MICDPASRAGAVLEIDLGAIVANWRQLAALAAPAGCAAVVKANAYGLGAASVAGALAGAGCRLFFVATLDEAIELRRALGAALEIAVFNGPLPGDTREFIDYGLIPVLNEPGQIAAWGSVVSTSPGSSRPSTAAKRESRAGSADDNLPAILHIDTGMARLGLSASEFAALLEHSPRLAWRAVMSHLACADDPGDDMNERQRARFAAAAARLPSIPASLAASSGIFLGTPYHFDLVRPGAALYGVNPCPGRRNPLRPVVRLVAKILQTRQIDRGESVGYGAAHVMAAAGRVATAAVGYADGWLRSLGQRGCGFVAGTRVPLIGRVSMDLVTFDVSAIDAALVRPGAEIELLGADYQVDDAAADAGTIGYEILTRLGARCRRVYVAPGRNAPG
jgi:alanine racemase